tara:strand:+ start:1215 stop:1733 length:519 start_codon:yes stop_codon:yes gene_type:complete
MQNIVNSFCKNPKPRKHQRVAASYYGAVNDVKHVFALYFVNVKDIHRVPENRFTSNSILGHKHVNYIGDAALLSKIIGSGLNKITGKNYGVSGINTFLASLKVEEHLTVGRLDPQNLFIIDTNDKYQPFFRKYIHGDDVEKRRRFDYLRARTYIEDKRAVVLFKNTMIKNAH